MVQQTFERIVASLERVVVGKRRQIEMSLTCLVGGGHLLLEDVPGVGKTTLAEALARVFGLSFARVQFTADLLPADIIGAAVYRAQNGTFEFRAGPIFQQMVLADELNRAPPRTQSALLEAMAQGQVSVDGVSHQLPSPFVVVATQNPLDLAGTFPLPDSQLDRFLMRLSLGHPAADVEAKLIARRGSANPLKALTQVSNPAELASLQKRAADVTVDEAVAEYAVAIATATRQHPEIERGASTRGVLSLMGGAKARALLEGRTFATPGDLRQVALPVLAHRLVAKAAKHGAFSREESAHLVEEILRKVPAPR